MRYHLNLDELEISHFERDGLHREIMRTQGALTSRFGFDTRGRKHWQFASPLDSRTLSPRHSPNVLASDLIERDDNIVYRRYHYTAAGELERVEDKTRPDQRFDYDRTGRLMRHWPAPMREEWFGYDDAANRILPGNDSSPRHMTVGDNRQREVDGYHYDYDAWGNTLQRTTQDEEQHFEYDSDNRLITQRGARLISIASTRSTNRCASKGSTQTTKRGSTALPSATTTPTREGLPPKTR